jgi:hypothetical protein
MPEIHLAGSMIYAVDTAPEGGTSSALPPDARMRQEAVAAGQGEPSNHRHRGRE